VYHAGKSSAFLASIPILVSFPASIIRQNKYKKKRRRMVDLS